MANQLIRSFIKSGNIRQSFSEEHKLNGSTTILNLTIPGKLDFKQERMESTLLEIASTMCPVMLKLHISNFKK